MSETNNPALSDKEMEEIVERAVAPSAAPASSDSAPTQGEGSGERGPGLVDGTQGGQTLPGGLPHARGWSVEQGKILHRRAPRGDLEARVRQILRGDPRRRLGGF